MEAIITTLYKISAILALIPFIFLIIGLFIERMSKTEKGKERSIWFYNIFGILIGLLIVFI